APRLPQAHAQPDVAKASAALQAEAAQFDGDCFARVRCLEKARLPLHADDGLGQGTGANTAGSVEFTELGDGLLSHAVAGADGTDESPVGVRLAILSDRRVTQVHERP